MMYLEHEDKDFLVHRLLDWLLFMEGMVFCLTLFLGHSHQSLCVCISSYIFFSLALLSTSFLHLRAMIAFTCLWVWPLGLSVGLLESFPSSILPKTVANCQFGFLALVLTVSEIYCMHLGLNNLKFRIHIVNNRSQSTYGRNYLI